MLLWQVILTVRSTRSKLEPLVLLVPDSSIDKTQELIISHVRPLVRLPVNRRLGGNPALRNGHAINSLIPLLGPHTVRAEVC